MPENANSIGSYKDVAGPLAMTQDPTFSAMLEVFRNAWQSFLAELPKISSILRIDELPEIYVDLLAVEKRVPGYTQDLPIDVKRALVKQAIPLHQTLGTPYAVKQLLNLAFTFATLQENWQYGGAPYRFRITTTDAQTDPAKISLLNYLINSAKNVRSQLDGIFSINSVSGPEYVGGGVASYSYQVVTTV